MMLHLIFCCIFHFLTSSFEHAVLAGTPENNCADSRLIPMWSWGFARHCCQIFPNGIGRFRSRYEGGDIRNDPNYFVRSGITNGSVIYIASIDFPSFLEVFLRIPKKFRIVLVTGLEDIGVPQELWKLGRGEYLPIWEGKETAVTLSQFLSDRRLVRWFTQNYDYRGCNPFYCSSENKQFRKVRYRKLQRVQHNQLLDYSKKLVPIPIGVDMHSRAGAAYCHRSNYFHFLCSDIPSISNLMSPDSAFH